MLAPVLAMALAAAPRIAVMPVRAGVGVSPEVAAVLTEAVAGEVRRRSGAEAITHGEITSILSMEQQKRMLGCTDDACMAELGGALGAARMVTGEVARLGESFMVHLRIVDPRSVAVLAQSDRRLKGASYDDLLDALPVMVGELFRTPPPAGAAPPAKPAAVAQPAGHFEPPSGTAVVHLRGPSRLLRLIAWSEEPGMDPSKTFRRYVTGWDQAIAPAGADEFGAYWTLPTAEFKGGKVHFGFVKWDRRPEDPGWSPTAKIGVGACGATSWSLAESSETWIDPRDCQPRRTADEALRSGK